MMIASYKHHSKLLLLIDSFVVLLNLSTSYSIIPYLLFGQYDRYTNMLIIVGLNVVYSAIRFYKVFTFPRKDILFNIYLILSVCNFFSAGLTDTGWKSTLVYLFLNATFYLILCNLYRDYQRRYNIGESLWFIARGYIWLVAYCVTCCLLMFVVLRLGFNPYVNQINLKYDLFYDNYFNLSANYYYPYYLSILNVATDIRIPFFQDKGFISGIYHEPHILTFMTFPALFLMLYYARSVKNRIGVIVVFILILLLAGSTTNIGVVLFCVLLYLIHKMFFLDKKSFLWNLGTIMLIFISLGVVYSIVNQEDMSFILKKIESGSKDYSMATLEFALTPRTIMGSSFLNLSYLDRSTLSVSGYRDVGYINFITNILFLFVCGYYMVKLFFSKEYYKVAIFLFAAYFFVHSIKIAMVSYSLTMLMFVVFLISNVSKLKDKNQI